MLELPVDVCRCTQVAETSDSPMGAHLELNLQQEGKASLGSTPRASRAFMLSKVSCGHWDSACHQRQTLITQGCSLADVREEGMS